MDLELDRSEAGSRAGVHSDIYHTPLSINPSGIMVEQESQVTRPGHNSLTSASTQVTAEASVARKSLLSGSECVACYSSALNLCVCIMRAVSDGWC